MIMGPLPKGWAINRPGERGLLYREDGVYTHIMKSDGRINRNLIATILENYGYTDYAKRWYMDSIHAAAPDLYEALRMALSENGQTVEQAWDEVPLEPWEIAARAAIAKADGLDEK